MGAGPVVSVLAFDGIHRGGTCPPGFASLRERAKPMFLCVPPSTPLLSSRSHDLDFPCYFWRFWGSYKHIVSEDRCFLDCCPKGSEAGTYKVMFHVL